MSNQQRRRRNYGFITDKHAFIIALVIIIPFIILTFILTFFSANIDKFKDVSAIWGVWVGIVIGYFFGSRKVEVLTQRLDEIIYDIDVCNEEYDEDYEKLKNEKTEIEKKYNDAKQQLQHLVSSKFQNMDKKFLEGLKNEHGIIIYDE